MGLYRVEIAGGHLATIVRADDAEQALDAASMALAQILDAEGGQAPEPADRATASVRELNTAEVSELREMVSDLRQGR